MAEFCPNCPIAQYISELKTNDERQIAAGAAEALCRALVDVVLTDEEIEVTRQKEVSAWGGSCEGEVLNNRPGLAEAAAQCEMAVRAGICALYSI